MDLKRQKIDVLGVGVDDITEKDALGRILKMAKDGSRGHYVVTINSEFVMMARRNTNFARILDNADLALADGSGVVISKLILGGKVRERITGVDLVEKVCKYGADNPIRIGFLGGFGGIAEEVKKRQLQEHPGLKIVIAEPGDSTIGSILRLRRYFSTIGRIDILFVAYGMGRQEFLIEKIRKSLDVGVFIGVGGALDYMAGSKIRAPKWIQVLGFEWLFRLAMEPARLWRMRVLPGFGVLVLLTKLSKLFSF